MTVEVRTRQWLAVLAAVAVSLAGASRACALETDQFTVPPAPLVDVGPELAVEVMRRIEAAVGRVNDRAAARERAADAATGFWRRHHLRGLGVEQSERRLAAEVYHALAGPGLPECRIERWIRAHRFAHAPVRFEISCRGSVYGGSPLGRSPLIVSLSPTVNVFGVYCGADKIGHLFQQGHQYFDRYTREEGANADAGNADPVADALASAVRRGVDQERGMFGQALVGVYSNADLAANYAGFKLYLNLTRPVRVGGRVRPPLLVRRGGRWAFAAWRADPGAAAAFLRPFVSDHFNEALNPSRYAGPTRQTVRARWRQRSVAWVAFYHSTPAAEARRLARLATWHGEPYGHSGFEGLVTAVDTCFDVSSTVPLTSAKAAAGTPTPRPAAPRRLSSFVASNIENRR